jgi:rhamnose utilization protein RhaD (predicted bifunctional aldolase and dehydrogenase)
VARSSFRMGESPKRLTALAAKIGSDQSLVQGPGGNVSIKTRKGIWVKKSGTWLKKAKESEIFCFLPRREIIGQTYDQSQSQHPLSIETPFHTFIPFKCVVHVHSVGSLTWGLREPTEITHKVMGKLGLHLAPYIKPGQAIAEYIQENPTALKSKGIILANHGLITWSRTPKGGFRKLRNLERALLKEAKATMKSSSDPTVERREHQIAPLTPDHAVFFAQNQPIEGWVSEMNKALMDAINLIPSDQNVSFLKPEDILELITWDAEKIRRELND